MEDGMSMHKIHSNSVRHKPMRGDKMGTTRRLGQRHGMKNETQYDEYNNIHAHTHTHAHSHAQKKRWKSTRFSFKC